MKNQGGFKKNFQEMKPFAKIKAKWKLKGLIAIPIFFCVCGCVFISFRADMSYRDFVR